MVRLFEGAIQNWKFVVKFILFSLIFFALQFYYQLYVLIPGEFNGSLLRSAALSGATFFGAALFSSALFKWRIVSSKYWYIRRSLGVMGFVFILIHVLSVTTFLYQWDFQALFWNLNPFENPIIFGLLAFPIFFLMALTSTDWMVEKISYTKWKMLHRLVYFGYIFAVMHFLLINPALLMNLAGYLLLVITFLALTGQFFWFLKISSEKKFSTLGTKIGFVVIFLALFLGYTGLVAPALMVPDRLASDTLSQNVIEMDDKKLLEEDLEISINKMKEFMENTVLPVPDSVGLEEKNFSGFELKTGEFEKVNYMTSGLVSLIEKDGDHFLLFNESFVTPNGPDLVVYFTKNSAPTTRTDIANGVVLGDLKSLQGKQVYKIPREINIDEFNSVSIHCRAFNVPWSYAPFK